MFVGPASEPRDLPASYASCESFALSIEMRQITEFFYTENPKIPLECPENSFVQTLLGGSMFSQKVTNIAVRTEAQFQDGASDAG